MDELECPCGAKEKDLEFFRLTHYRPKEFIVKCSKCTRQVGGKGNHLHVMERAWRKKFMDGIQFKAIQPPYSRMMKNGK